MNGLVLEMTVNTKLVTTLNNIISVGAEYIDVSANDNECIFSTEYKGLIFAGKIPLTKRISKCDLRIPSQILKQITSDYSLVKFFIETEVRYSGARRVPAFESKCGNCRGFGGCKREYLHHAIRRCACNRPKQFTGCGQGADRSYPCRWSGCRRCR